MKIEKSRFNSEASPHPGTSPAHIDQANEHDISVIRLDDVTVRILNINGEPWFIAKDVCDALELSNHIMAIAALDDDEKGVSLTYTPGGKQSMRTVAESGFYKLIARSRKASTPGTFAHKFTNWVFREVIPSIRKTGSYGVPFAFLNDYSKRKDAYDKKASKRGKELQACKPEKARLITEEAELWRKYQPQLPEVH